MLSFALDGPQMTFQFLDLSKAIAFKREEYQQSPVEYNPFWTIPGRGNVTRDTCGVIKKAYRCRNHEKLHVKTDGCYQKTCPICYKKWITRKTNDGTQKIVSWCYWTNCHRLYHVTFSLSNCDLDYDSVKSKIVRILRSNSKNYAANIIFHPFRAKCLGCGLGKTECECRESFNAEFLYSPHFHVITNVGFFDSKSIGSFVVKVIKPKTSGDRNYFSPNINEVAGRLQYELSHAGVCRPYSNLHTISWVGQWSSRYSLSVSERHVQPIVCPECELPLDQVYLTSRVHKDSEYSYVFPLRDREGAVILRRAEDVAPRRFSTTVTIPRNNVDYMPVGAPVPLFAMDPRYNALNALFRNYLTVHTEMDESPTKLLHVTYL